MEMLNKERVNSHLWRSQRD